MVQNLLQGGEKMDYTNAYPGHKHNDFKRDLRGQTAMSSSMLTMMFLAACSNNGTSGIEAGTAAPAGENVAARVFTSANQASVNENDTSFSHSFITTPDVDDDEVTYRITGGADSDDFELTTAGVLTLKEAPDHESGKTIYEVIVTASTGTGDEAQSATQTFTLNVTDVNDVAPVFAEDTPTALTVEENTILSAVTFSATGDVGDVFYSLAGTDASAFVIDSGTGVLTQPATTSFDYDVKNSYSFDVVATVGSLSTNHAVTVSVTDQESITGDIYLLTLKADHLVVSGRTDDLIFAADGNDVI